MSDKTCIITGGLGFLGSHVATLAQTQGYRVAILDIGIKVPAPLAADLAANALVKTGIDLTDSQAVAAAIDGIQAELGHIDALFNIAGGFTWETLADGQIASWEKMHQMNLMTALNCCSAVLPAMKARKAGAIVNVGANAALKAGMGMGSYTASKAGVHKLTESLAEELKADNIRVNAVLPSIIDTPTNRADMPDADFGAWVKAGDLAEAMLFLASDKATAITGALLPVVGRV